MKQYFIENINTIRFYEGMLYKHCSDAQNILKGECKNQDNLVFMVFLYQYYELYLIPN